MANDRTTAWIFIIQDNVQRTRSLSSAVSSFLRDVCSQIYQGLGHDLELSGLSDVTRHVTIWNPRCHCNRVCISSHFRDNGSRTCWHYKFTWRHCNVTSRFAILCHFLIGTESLSIFDRFRDIRRQNPWARAHTHRLSHAVSTPFIWLCAVRRPTYTDHLRRPVFCRCWPTSVELFANRTKTI